MQRPTLDLSTAYCAAPCCSSSREGCVCCLACALLQPERALTAHYQQRASRRLQCDASMPDALASSVLSVCFGVESRRVSWSRHQAPPEACVTAAMCVDVFRTTLFVRNWPEGVRLDMPSYCPPSVPSGHGPEELLAASWPRASS